MSTLVQREGAHQITVQDDDGREAALVCEDGSLHLHTEGEGPHLTPHMARELADELEQWANRQLTVRTRGSRRSG